MKMLFVLGARSELGYISPVYHEAKKRGHSVSIWACNTASLAGFGDVAQVAKKAGLSVRQIVMTSFDGYSQVAMAKSVGAVTQSFADFLGNEDFDWVVLSGDRAEQLGAAIASSYMYVPTAHIQAGERSGNIDGLARHAIARLAHLHFAANEDAKSRLLKSGEEDWRVVLSGAPQLDGLVESATARAQLEERRLIPPSAFVLAIFHPETAQLPLEVTLLGKLVSHLSELAEPVVWIAPNNDAGSSKVRAVIMENLRPMDFFHENVSRPDFAGMLANCDFLVGNSSAGLIEAPSFLKPAINVGGRQDCRFQGRNVINVDGEDADFVSAFERATNLKRELLQGQRDYPYGRGNSSQLIVDSLEASRIHPSLLLKQLSY